MSVSDGVELAVTQIGNTAEMLRLMLAHVAPLDLSWKPQPSRFSHAEILAHLTHVDEHCFGPRLKRILEEDIPELEEYDDNSFQAAGIAFVCDGPARMADFFTVRAKWAAFVAAVPREKMLRTGKHPSLGTVSASEIVHIWAFHDLGHIRQAAEVLRARPLYAGIGPFQTFYKVRP
ncbi:MAG: DinB family protein [Acidobacteria bacterium]|nr:DinB family protein [Acidobacteriota bacterium]